MTTTYYVASSIDGFIADRDGGLDWLLAFGMEEFTPHYEEFLATVGVVVMGATTYEFVAAEQLDAWPYEGMQTRVLTHRDLPPAVDGADIRFESGDVVALHADWVEAAAGRDVWIVGGGAIAAQLADAGLLDAIDLTIMPIALGAGSPPAPPLVPPPPAPHRHHPLPQRRPRRPLRAPLTPAPPPLLPHPVSPRANSGDSGADEPTPESHRHVPANLRSWHNRTRPTRRQ